jgi:hypothetical protein
MGQREVPVHSQKPRQDSPENPEELLADLRRKWIWVSVRPLFLQYRIEAGIRFVHLTFPANRPGDNTACLDGV